jgi:dephospho-CoA kinase
MSKTSIYFLCYNIVQNLIMNGMKVVCIVGMPGSGKSEVAKLFKAKGYNTVRFGDITDEEVKKQGLKLNEENERKARESLRQQHGMDAYAKLSLPRIEAALKTANAAVDGLYSWEEYTYLKNRFVKDFIVVAIWSSPEDRYKRLGSRKIRPLTPEEAESRDKAEIQNMNKGGPIAMADFTILNDASLSEMKQQVDKIIARIK